MALTITDNHSVLEITGSITGQNSTLLQQYFEELLTMRDEVIVSLDGVKKIDAFGIQVFTKLCENAMKLNKIFFLIGKENKNIQAAFGKVSYILRSDFV